MSISAATAPSSPYKGLAAFDDTELDALLFFGREWETEVVSANVLASRLTVFYGPSGVGKSSLLRAGVMRALRSEGGLTPPAVTVYGSWAGDPLVGLEEAARAAVGEALGRAPAEAPGTLTDRLAAWSAELGSELCLLLDQLEELFLYHPAAEGAGGFVELLPELVLRPGLHVNVLLGIRDDALAQLDVFKRRIPGLFANSLRLDHLDRDAARAAILGPLDRYNEMVGAAAVVAIEPELVDAVLDEVAAGRIGRGGAGQGGLGNGAGSSGRVETPYLQLVLQRVWEVERERGSATLRLATFQGLGGAQRIVEDHLQRALNALTPTQQDAAADVFGHLVTPSGTKIAHGVTDLASYAAMREGELEPVLRSLAQERILRPLGENGHAAGDRYEIFHDVLAGAVLSWRTRHESEAALARERELARRRHRRLLFLTAAALLALAAMTALTAYAFSQRSEANEQARRAEEQADIAASNQAYAYKLAQQADASAAQAKKQTAIARKSQKEAEKSAEIAADARQLADEKADAAEAAKQEAKQQAALAGSNAAIAQDREQKAKVAKDAARRAEASAKRAARKAKDQAAIAEQARKRARRAERIASARALAQAAFASLTVDPERSLRLALTAADTITDDLVENSLRQALIESRLRLVLPAGARVRSASYSPDGNRVVVASDDGIARIFRVRGDKRKLLLELRDRRSIFTASFDPSGKHVITAGLERSARIWSAATGRLEHSLAHRDAVASATFSLDGKLIVTGSADGTVGLWHENGEPIRKMEVDGPVRSAKLSPDGSLTAAVVQGPGRVTARVFETATGDLLHVPDQRGIADVAFSPDSSLLATASSDRTAKLWRARSGEFLREFSQPEGRIEQVNFSPDGRFLVTASQGGTAGLWNVATGNRVHLLCCPDNFVETASFSPDGRFVVIASLDRTARVYETLNGRQTKLLAGHKDSVLAAEFSPDGQRVLTASADGTARVWDPGTADDLGVRGRHSGAVRTASFSPNGKLILSAGDDGFARLWPTRGGAAVKELRHGRAIAGAVFSGDGSMIASASPNDRSVRVWSAASGTELYRVPANRPQRVLFAAKSGLLLVIDAAGPTRTYRASDGRPRATLAAEAPLSTASFSRDGSLIVGGSADGVGGIWNATTGKLLHPLRGHKGRLVAASFGPGDRLVLTASEDSTARLWDAKTGEQEHALAGHGAPLTDARFDRAGRRVVTASRDNDARTWSVATGKLIRTLRAHFGAVTSASYSPDGRWIVTAGPTTAGLWRASTGRLLSFLRGPASTVTGASFSPDGRRVVASSQDGTVRVYQCEICGGQNELEALAGLRLDRAHGRR